MIFEVLTNPRMTLENAAHQRKLWAGAGVVTLWALLNLALTALLVFGGDLRGRFAGLSPAVLEQVVLTLRNLGPVAALLFPFVWWISVSALTLVSVPLFGGRAGYASVAAVVGVACAPWVLGYAVQLPVGMLQLVSGDEGWLAKVLGGITFVVSAASLVAHVVLVVYGVRSAAGTSYRGAAASCALTGLGCVTAGLVLLVSVLTLLFLLSGAT